MKGNTFVGLLAAAAIAIPAAAWGVQPVNPCDSLPAGAICITGTTCSNPTYCSDHGQCNVDGQPINQNGLCEPDTNPCTQDLCDGGTCKHNKPTDCNDGNACTTDSCDPSLPEGAACLHAPVDCDDGVACTTDTCNPTSGCQHTFITNDCTATCGTSACGNPCGPPCSTACVPEITCPGDVTVECVDGAGQNTLGGATATCNADITNNGDTSYAFTCDGNNSHDVTYTATDSDGSDTCTATLTVVDTGKPSATCGASSTVRTSEQGGLCSASLTPSASGTDACQGALTGTCDPDELTLNGPGTTTATCTAEDCSGNISDPCTQSLTLIDDTPPTITCATPYVTPPLAPMSWTASTVTDNCGGATTTNVTSVDCYVINGSGKVVSKLAACKASYSGNNVSVGPSAGGVGTIIKWTVSSKDASGNTSTATCMTQVQNPGLTKP